ncbi:hypothetical protein AX14_008001 [Amanita brunnescens Koide BX004]|nr:hypothetical protein AX14_008001 [Amanita brunnescens Koide BX004]
MRLHDCDGSVYLYEYPYAGLFRDYVQTYTPPPVANPPTPEVAGRAAGNVIIKDPLILSPFNIKGLSLEFIRNMFIFACGEGVLSPSRDSPQDTLRLTLQLVCKDWRRIAIGCPALWNDLDLRIMPRREQRSNEVGMVSVTDTDASLRCARSWLGRAGNSLISLRLLMFPCVEAEAAQHHERITSFLSAYRFEALAIRAPILSLLDFHKSLDTSLVHIKTIALTAPNWAYPKTQLFSHRPPFSWLRSLSLTVDDSYMFENLLSAFPWHRLEQVTLSIMKQPELTAAVLRKCKSIVDCTIHIQEYDEVNFLNDIYLPRLRHLSIVSNIVGFANDNILTATIAPKLELLSISGLFGASLLTFGRGRMPAVSSFHDCLRKLVLRSFDGVVDLCRVLKLFPALRTVELFNATIDVDTACLLSHGMIGTYLQELSISGYDHDFRPGPLLDMVEERQINAKLHAPIAPFTSVLLCFPSTEFSDIAAQYSERVALLRDKYSFELALGEFQRIPDYSSDAEDEARQEVTSASYSESSVDLEGGTERPE